MLQNTAVHTPKPFPSSVIRVGTVAYRDYGDADLASKDFTPDVDSVIEYMAGFFECYSRR
jgi:hypothetical protein